MWGKVTTLSMGNLKGRDGDGKKDFEFLEYIFGNKLVGEREGRDRKYI